MKSRLGIVALVLAVAFVALTLFIVCSDEPPPRVIPTAVSIPVPGSEVPTSAAVPCELVELNDISVPGRSRARAFISIPSTMRATSALTADERVQTALQAAVDVRDIKGFDYVLVQLMFDKKAMSAGWAAEAEYAPDGYDQSGKTRLRNGTWQAAFSELAPTEDELAIIRAWDKHADAFRDSDGLLDEKKLKVKIEKETGASLEAITAARDRYGYSGKLVDYDAPRPE